MEDKRVLLAESIIKNNFGPTVHKVCQVLIYNGPQSMEEIGEKSGLDQEKVKESLLTAIQHNIVLFNKQAKRTRYQVSLEHVLVRARFVDPEISFLNLFRFSRFLHLAREKHKDIGQYLVSEVIAQGRTTIGHLVARVHEIKKGGTGPTYNEKKEEEGPTIPSS